ncbi:CidA/LrgA family protein [Acerihabitans arboris]|uniref:CidA/LrgA family protein n=1 Tax=Acerihabitans arboris TaxID=2691583 RepID=A0A845SP08_9GAMM|nr:CidA/LrgA family protein [Acerihabitans arboris]NDL65112.1 CidA/LrgA family protein [Acerihabitans arboris]
MLLPGRINMPLRVLQCQLLLQVGLYVGLFLIAQQLVARFHLPLPANVVGMFMLLALILSGVVQLNWVAEGARWLLAEMLLFFVPAVVAVINYTQLLMVDGWRIFVVIAVSTVLVLGITGMVVDRVYRFEQWLTRRKTHHD